MNTLHHLKYVVVIAIFLTLIVNESECRGGRGRGGGSFGGIFGGWRKYKKPSSSGSSRRTTNGSPMHTTLTKSSSGSSASSIKYSSIGKTHASYPKQSMPSNNGAFVPNGQKHVQMPPGSTYYANAGAMPQGAVFYSQPPTRSGTGDFLFGMMVGHVASRAMFGPRPYVTHVYHQNAPQNNNGEKVIIINNANSETNTTDSPLEGEQQISWPTDMDSTSSSESTSETMEQESDHDDSLSQTGIICMPILFNQTTDGSPIDPVEKLVCFPAPSTPAPETTTAPKKNCLVHKVPQPDPTDENKTIYVEIEDCIPEKPIPVAGEIGEKVLSDDDVKSEKDSNDEIEA